MTTDPVDVFTVLSSLNIALAGPLIPALTYQHPSLRQLSSPDSPVLLSRSDLPGYILPVVTWNNYRQIER